MTYEEFKSKYENLIKEILKYSPDQVGSGYFAEKLGELVDEYPEYEKKYDSESLIF